MAVIDTGVFKAEGVHPLVLLREYLRLFGAGALEWEPFVIKRSVDGAVKENISRVNLTKLMAAITIANHDNFWTYWETFHTVSQALAGKIPSVSHIDNQSISDLMMAVDAAFRIRKDLGSVSDIPEFSEEVRRYMAAQLHESGIWYAPEPLAFLNPLISGETQVCGLCKNEETPKEDGMCSYCTDRYNTDSLLKFEPDDDLKKVFDGSKVKIISKFPTKGVQDALRRAQKSGGEILQEDADDICAAKILEGLRDLEKYQAQLGTTKTAGISNAPRAVTAHNLANPDNEIQIPGSQSVQPKSPILKYVNPISVGGTALIGGALLRRPGMAGKFLNTAKEVVTKPITSIGRSMRSGANYVGPGADEFARGAAQSKRVELMSDSLRSLNDTLREQATLGKPLSGRVDQFSALAGGEQGLGTFSDKLRRSGFASAGRKKFDNVAFDEATADKLNKLVSEMDAASAAGKTVDYSKIRGLYDELGNTARQQVAAGTARQSKGLGYYAPGERVMEVASPLATGGAAYADDTDPETGRKRSTAERLARGVTAGGVAAGTGALFAGRNLGLSKANLITGKGRSGFSAKTIVPAVGGMAVGSAVEDLGADAVGAGARAIDTAFGQKKDTSS
jgi:hypothetical protein